MGNFFVFVFIVCVLLCIFGMFTLIGGAITEDNRIFNFGLIMFSMGIILSLYFVSTVFAENLKYLKIK